MTQATTQQERKWALRFNYSNSSFTYAGAKRRFGYSNAERLDKGVLFASEQDALQDMMHTYKNLSEYAGHIFPVPVPVDEVTETKPGIVREALPGEFADGYAVKCIPADALCFVGDTAIASRPNLNPTTVFASSYTAYEAIAKVGRFLGFLSKSYTVVPVVRAPGETVVTITEVSRCDG